jgi:hypothetical protein
MKAETVSIVNDLKKVTINQVTFEAITNSIHAGASHIDMHINSVNSDFDDIENQFVSEIKVFDNGHGFKAEDINSFQTYRSRHKKTKFGAKGIGRFLFLKLFDSVNILSLDKIIKFNVENDVVVLKSEKISKRTCLHIRSPKQGYQINKQSLVKAIKLHFLPLFKLINTKQTNNVVSISVHFDGEKYKTIKSEDIPNFKETEFSIDDHVFKVSYLLNHSEYISGDGAYCAGGRVVCLNSQMDSSKRFKAFKNINFFYLLSSTYFDNNLNDERDELTINAKRKSQSNWVSALSWEDIFSSFGEAVKQICLENGIDINERSQKYLEKAVNRAPFLSMYFTQNELMLDDEDLLKQAQKLFNDEKEKLRSKEPSLSNIEHQIILNRVVQAELAEYVFDRQKTIDKLKSLEDENALEKEIHDLFMKRFTQSENSDFRTNNLWLFDDRFMSYDKIFSDLQIKTIFPELHANLDKPDILTISGNTFEKEQITDIVVIELKRPEAQNDVAIAESELLKYSRFARASNHQNIRIWTYAFISFDEEASLALDDKSYNKIPVHGGWPIRYKYHDKPNTIINFIDYKALAYDAESRNNTFLNILKAKHYEAKD